MESKKPEAEEILERLKRIEIDLGKFLEAWENGRKEQPTTLSD